MTISANYPTIRPSLLLDFANTEQLDPRITFSRPTTATYYDNHTTVVAEQNLLIYSEQFDNAYWVKYEATVTANSTTAPDSNTTADTITESSATDLHVAYANSSLTASAIYTFSVFLKANARNYGMLRVGGGGVGTGPAIKIDLTNGTVTTLEGTVISSSATSVGSGWYRCSMTFTAGPSAGHTPQFGPHNNGSAISYTGNGTGSVYAWGAQLEQRSSVTAYQVTTTQAITNYIPVLLTQQSNEARFDHNPTTRESLGLLIEEQRTNLFTYSADFSNAAWTKSNATITSSIIVSPDGAQTGSKLVDTTGNAEHLIFQTCTSGSYTVSVYAKAAEKIWLRMGDSSGAKVWFNLSTGAVGANPSAVSATITSVGNGWYRCAYKPSSSFTNASFMVANADSGNAYTGNGFDGIYIWGAQLEGSSSFATSYIPTVASQVTRSADSASMTGANFSSWYAGSENTWYVNFQYPSLFSANRSVIGSNLNSNMIYSYNNTIVTYDGTNYSTNATTFTANQNCKFAVAQSSIAGTQTSSLNGISGTTVAYNKIYFSTTSITIASPNNSGVSYIKKIAYYPKSLTSAELVGLTTV